MPSLPPIPARLSRIDDLVRPDHFNISESDDCYFLWEWNAAPYAESATTNFIGNFQKDMRFKDQVAWWYKQRAIDHAASALGATLPTGWRSRSTFIPIPPSKIGDRYDARLLDALRRILPPLSDIRDLVRQKSNAESRQKNISPEDRLRNWEVNPARLLPKPEHVVIFDDVLAGGSHFAAMKIVIARRWPKVPVSGIFLARRVLPASVRDLL